MDERSAANFRVAGLCFTQVVRSPLVVHLSDLPLKELLGLPHGPIHVFIGDGMIAQPALNLLKLVEDCLENIGGVNSERFLSVLERLVHRDCLCAQQLSLLDIVHGLAFSD